MKKLASIALIMVLGLSGCTCYGTCVLIKEDFTDFGDDPGRGSWQFIKEDFTDFWDDPGRGSWQLIKEDWTHFWN